MDHSGSIQEKGPMGEQGGSMHEMWESSDWPSASFADANTDQPDQNEGFYGRRRAGSRSRSRSYDKPQRSSFYVEFWDANVGDG